MATIERHVTRDLVALDGETTCAAAARRMAEQGIGSVAVRVQGRCIGLVTERDLVYEVMARGGDTAKSLGEVMRNDRPSVTASATERDCAYLMQKHQTRHLLVKKDAEVVGVISMLDVLSLMLEDNRFLIEQLHTYIRGGRGG